MHSTGDCDVSETLGSRPSPPQRRHTPPTRACSSRFPSAASPPVLASLFPCHWTGARSPPRLFLFSSSSGRDERPVAGWRRVAGAGVAPPGDRPIHRRVARGQAAAIPGQRVVVDLQVLPKEPMHARRRVSVSTQPKRQAVRVQVLAQRQVDMRATNTRTCAETHRSAMARAQARGVEADLVLCWSSSLSCPLPSSASFRPVQEGRRHVRESAHL